MQDVQYWLSRVAWEGRITYALLEKGYLPIGWCDFSNRSFIEKIQKGGTAALDQALKDAKWEPLPRNRYCLYHFVATMKAGDYIVVPHPGTFDVYKIENEDVLCLQDLADVWANIKLTNGDSVHIGKETEKSGYLLTTKGEIVDVGFFRRIIPVCLGIPREAYCDSALISRMKYRGMNLNISDLSQQIQEAISRYEKKSPIDIHTEIANECIQIVLDKLLQKTSPDGLERVVEQYFRTIGATDINRPAKNCSKEGGADADVIADFKHLRTIIYVQVKHHKGNTDNWAIDQIAEWKRQKGNSDPNIATIAWVISTGTFPDNVRQSAIEENVILIDGEDFARMLLEAGISSLQKL